MGVAATGDGDLPHHRRAYVPRLFWDCNCRSQRRKSRLWEPLPGPRMWTSRSMTNTHGHRSTELLRSVSNDVLPGR